MARRPQNAVASSLRASALPPPHFRHPPARISRLNEVSVWASLLPLRSRHPPTLMQCEIASEWVSPRNLDRRLPALVPLAATPPALPVLWICDPGREPLRASIVAQNTPERRAGDRAAIPIGSGIYPYRVRVECRCAAEASWPDNHTRGTPRNPDELIALPILREPELPRAQRAVQADRTPDALK